MTMTATAPAKKNAVSAKPGPFTVETVLSVTHYTDRLFHFRITRPDAFRFRSGEFIMICPRKTANRCCVPIRSPARSGMRPSIFIRSRFPTAH
jgi:NAD(P)H-flavin reductase